MIQGNKGTGTPVPGATRVLAAGLVALLLAVMGMVTAGPSARAAGTDNPISVENALPGTTAWSIPNPGRRISSGVNNEIKGYASTTSAAAGQSVDLKVTVNPPQSFTLDLYRLGWYGGTGGRLVTRFGPVDGETQPDCPMVASTGLLECQWATSLSLSVDAGWTTGVYVGVLTSATGYQNYVTFVVRNDQRAADLLFQSAVTTYQAYNNWPDDNATGKSTYSFNSNGPQTASGTAAAVKASFDRPYAGNGAGQLFVWELNYIRWMESRGYDVSYSTDLDTHERGEDLQRFKTFLSVGHDEYWSRPMYDAAVAARDSGHSLAFFGANAIYHPIRFEPSGNGVADRTMVAYKAPGDPVTGPDQTSKLWREMGRPEGQFLGVQYAAYQTTSYDFVVQGSDHWVYAGTGLHDGDVLPGLVGYESDRVDPTARVPAGSQLTILSTSPLIDSAGRSGTSNASIYRAPSGSLVFAAGTIQWSWGLDALNHHQPDPRVQTITSNILDALIANKAVPLAPSPLASASTGTSPVPESPPAPQPTPSSTSGPSKDPQPAQTTPPALSPTTSPSPAEPSCLLRMVLAPSLTTAGNYVRATVRGAPPSSRVELDGYSQPESTYHTVRAPQATNADGTTTFVVPVSTNTRLRAAGELCGTSESAVVKVQPRMTIRARRTGRLRYSFSGRVVPGPPSGAHAVTLCYRTADGRCHRRAVASARPDGTYSVDVRFTGPGRLPFYFVTAANAVNVAGSSPLLTVTLN